MDFFIGKVYPENRKGGQNLLNYFTQFSLFKRNDKRISMHCEKILF